MTFIGDAVLEHQPVGLDGQTPYARQQATERALMVASGALPQQQSAASIPPLCEVDTHQLPSVWARLAPMASRVTW